MRGVVQRLSRMLVALWMQYLIFSGDLTIHCSVLWCEIVQFPYQTFRELVRTLSTVPLQKEVKLDEGRFAFIILLRK